MNRQQLFRYVALVSVAALAIVFRRHLVAGFGRLI